MTDKCLGGLAVRLLAQNVRGIRFNSHPRVNFMSFEKFQRISNNIIMLPSSMLLSLHRTTLKLAYTNVMLCYPNEWNYTSKITLHYTNVIILWYILLCCLPTFMSLYVCMYVCMCMFACWQTCLTCMCICMYIFMYWHTYVGMQVNIYADI